MLLTRCETSNKTDTVTPQEKTILCQKCPKFNNGQDTLKYVKDVMYYVARTADAGLLDNEKIMATLDVPFDRIDADRVVEIFEHDSGIADCGQVASLMAKILVDNGVDAYIFSFGFDDMALSRSLVLVKVNGQLLMFDPIQNYWVEDEAGHPLGLINLITQVGKGELKVRTSADTVIAEMLIDQRKLPKPPLQKNYRLDSECFKYWSKVETVRDSVIKKKFTRCFACETDRPCMKKNFREQFVDTLAVKTLLTSYHQGFVVNPHVISGAKDAQRIDDMIQTAIYSQPGLGKLVNGRIK